MTEQGKAASTNANAPSMAKQGSEGPKSEPVTNPVSNNQSLKPVGGTAPSATSQTAGAGNEPPKNPVNANAQADLDHNTAADQPVHDDPAADLSVEEEKRLEKILDGEDDDAPASLSDGDHSDFEGVSNKLKKLIIGIPESTPDTHTVWGAAGVVLTLGDLRTLVKYMR